MRQRQRARSHRRPDSRIAGLEQIDLNGGDGARAVDLREILNIDDASNALGAATGTHRRRRRLQTFALGQPGIDTGGLTTEAGLTRTAVAAMLPPDRGEGGQERVSEACGRR